MAVISYYLALWKKVYLAIQSRNNENEEPCSKLRSTAGIGNQ